jgi:hypothetical protein
MASRLLGVGHAALGSDIIRAEGDDKFGGLPVDLSLSLETCCASPESASCLPAPHASFVRRGERHPSLAGTLR